MAGHSQSPNSLSYSVLRRVFQADEANEAITLLGIIGLSEDVIYWILVSRKEVLGTS